MKWPSTWIKLVSLQQNLKQIHPNTHIWINLDWLCHLHLTFSLITHFLWFLSLTRLTPFKTDCSSTHLWYLLLPCPSLHVVMFLMNWLIHFIISLGFISLCLHAIVLIKNQINPSAEDLSAPLRCVNVPFRINFTVDCCESGFVSGCQICQPSFCWFLKAN